MANEYTQQEIDEILSRVADEMDKLGYVSEQTAKDMKNMSTGVKNYTENLNNSFKRLGTSIGHLAGNMAKGATGAAQYTDALGDAAGLAASALSALGPIGKLAGGALKGMGESAKLVGSQADSVYKSFQELSKSGMSTAGGMSTVFNNMQKLGYSVEELGNFNAIVGKNSETLSSFGATAGQGLAAFAGVANEIKNSQIGFEFRNMGMSVDDINTGIAGFLKMQTLNGSRAKLTNDQLQEGSQRYIRELNLLSKLTGQSNEKLLQNREEMLAQERFAGLKYELQQRIDSNDKADSEIAKRQLEQINLTYEGLGKFGKEAQTGFINSLTNTVSDANAKFLRTMPEAFALSQEPVIDSNKILGAAARNAATYMDNFGTAAAKIGASGDFGLAVQDLMKGLAFSKLSFEERVKEAEKNRIVTDESTTAMTKLIDTQKNTTIQLQAMANAAFKNVVPAFQGIATASLFAAKTLRETLGVDMGGVNEFGGGQLFKKPLPVDIESESESGIFSKIKKFFTIDYSKNTQSAAKPAIGGEMQTDLLSRLSASGITDQRAQANVLAQFEAESRGRADSVESLNYSAERLVEVFPQKFKNLQDAQAVVAQGQEAVGNRVYGGRMGNAKDEGFKYRGRGLVQLTGKDNYKKFGEMLGLNLVDQPDLAANPEIAKQIAVAYVKEKQKSGTDLTDIAELGKAIGYAGGQKETAKRANLAEKFLQDGAVPEGYTQTQMEPGTAARQRQEMWAASQKRIRDAEARKAAPKMANGGVIQAAPGGVDIVAGEAGKNEAVVPLPDGKTIPVQIAGSDEQLGLMSAQLSKLDDLVRVMQNQLGVSQKLLQYAQ